MPTYDLELYTRTSTPIAALDQAQLEQVTWELNGPGQLDFTMSQDDPDVTKPLLVEQEIRCTIEGVANPWQGPLWQDEQGPRRVKFSAEGIASYLTRRYIDISSMVWDADPTGYDQLTIGWGLVAYALGQTVPVAGVTTAVPRKNFNVTSANFADSGRKRLRRYLRNEHQEILPLLQEFNGLRNFTTGVVDGFDWDFITYADGRREWTPYYPQKGSLRTDLTLEYGRNISEFTVREDGKEISTKAYCTGGSTGDTKLEANYEDTVASDRYTQMVSIIDDSSQSDTNELANKARKHVEDRKRPLLDVDIKSVQVPVKMLGVFQPGDRVPIKISRGRTQVEDIYRIDKITWKVRPDVLELTLVPKVVA